MADFGKYGSTGQVTEYVFALEPDWLWCIKPATFNEERERDAFFSKFEIVTDKEGETRREGWPTEWEMKAEEIWLSFAGTNMPVDVSKPLVPINKIETVSKNLRFPYGVRREKFMLILGELPMDMIREIHKAVIGVNLNWDPTSRGGD